MLTVPLVSVVIPTVRRPALLLRAVKSALAQTVRDIEVIVVVDGPDAETTAAVHHVQDPRLKIRQLPHNAGKGGAINAGMDEARSHWIAMLDDDDEWLPHKLEVQLTQAQRSAYAHPIVATRFIARTAAGDLVWPRRYPEPGEVLCEYLFCQRGIRGGEGSVLPSSILTTRDLMRLVPWRPGLPRLVDSDWLVRVGRTEGAHLEFPASDEPLVIYHCDESHSRISVSDDWRYCLSWIRSNRHLVTPRAYASFVLTMVSMTAARAREKSVFFVLLREAWARGTPTAVDLLAHAVIWLIPWSVRTKVAVALDSRRSTSETKAQVEPQWTDADNLPAGIRDICNAILARSSAPGVERLREERGKRSFRVEISSGSAAGNFIVKEFGPRGPLDALVLQHVRPVPGRRYPSTSAAIRNAGILTPAVRFAVRDPRGPRYVIVIDRVQGAQTLQDVLTWLPSRDRAQLFRTIGQSVARLHRAGIFHFDLSQDNLIFDDARGYLNGPYFVDLDLTVRASVKRTWLCRVLARFDRHQFFTIRLAEIGQDDRRMFAEGYRGADTPPQPIAWRARPAGAVPSYGSYPSWKRYIGTSLIHLFRGSLLVCRAVH